MKFPVIAALLAIGGAPGMAWADQVSTPGRVVDPDRIICRNLPLPGSRLHAARACGTAAEWAAYHAEIRAGMRQIQGEGSTFCTPNTRVPISTCR